MSEAFDLTTTNDVIRGKLFGLIEHNKKSILEEFADKQEKYKYYEQE